MSIYFRKILSILSITCLFWVSSSVAKTTWIPINNGGVTFVIPFIPNGLFVAPTNVQKTLQNGIVTLKWDDIQHASKYLIQGQSNDGTWVDVKVVFSNEATLELANKAYEAIRVLACNYNTCQGMGQPSESVSTSALFESNTKPYEQVSIDTVINDETLPQGEGAPLVAQIGVVNGQASVQGGAAVFNIPIELPPGRAGMQPNVSLNYSSKTGNGIAGVGWSLSAGSSITRCSATFAQDGFTRNPQYSSDDKLCLNGQRLMLAEGGTYGANGAVYRTEIDSFVKVTQSGGLNGSNTSFTVKYKNGRTAVFGVSEDSRIVHGGKSAAYSWLIEYEHDSTENNFIHYEYENFDLGEVLLSSIYYTGVDKDTFGDRSVSFIYSASDNIYEGYQWGGKYRKSKVLTEITGTYKYKLVYDGELLNSLFKCKKMEYTCNESSSLATKTFEWQNRNNGYEHSVDHPFGNTNIDEDDLVLSSGNFYDSSNDYTGDGIPDIKMYQSIKETSGQNRSFSLPDLPEFYTPSGLAIHSHEFQGALDYNQDGKTDFVYMDSDRQLRIATYDLEGQTAHTLLDSAINLDCQITSSQSHGMNAYVYSPIIPSCKSAIFDLNGDGYEDLLIYQQANKTFEYYQRNTDSNNQPLDGFSYKNTISGFDFTGYSIDNSIKPAIAFSDIDGDGISDIYHHALGLWIKLEVVNDRLVATQQDLQINPKEINRVRRGKRALWLDINGDGLLDVMTLKGKTAPFSWHVHINKGAGSFETGLDTGLKELHTELGKPSEANSLSGFMHVFDYDKDGRADILVPNDMKYFYDCWDFSKNQDCIISDEDAGNDFSLAIYPYNIWSWKILKSNSDNQTFADIELAEDLLGALSTTGLQDINGDGWQDITTAMGFKAYAGRHQCGDNIPNARGRIYCYPNRAPEPGIYVYKHHENNDFLMREVRDDFGTQVRYTYQQLGLNANTENGIYSVDNEPLTDKTMRKIGSAQKVVSGFEVTDGKGGFNTTQYEYTNGVYYTAGRRFNGFKTIVEKDITKELVTQTDFRQDFPYQGKIERQATFKSDSYTKNGAPLSDNDSSAINLSTYSWADNPSHDLSGIYHIYPTEIIVKKIKDLDDTFLSTHTTRNNEIDEFGNITDSTVIIDDEGLTSYETNTVRAYDNNANTWFINKLTSSEVTKTSEGDTKTTSTVLSNYHANRRPETVVLREGTITGPLLKTTTTAFNDYGLPTSITESADTYKINGAKQRSSRTSTISYTKNGTSVSTDGYFPFTVTNAKGHKVTTHTNPATGQPTKVSKQIGASAYLDTVYGYDDYNRLYSVQTGGQPIRYTAVQTPDNRAPANSVMQIVTKSAGTPTTKVYKDKLGRTLRTAVQGFAKNSWIYNDVHYNNKGQITFESVPFTDINSPSLLGVSYSEFDVLGRPKYKVTSQSCSTFDDGTMTAKYTYEGFTTKIDVEETCNILTLPTMSRTYNSQKQLMSTVDAIGGKTTYSYNSLGLPTVVQDANGDSIVASYDSFGRKISVNDPNQGYTQFTYNGFGELQAESRKQTANSSAHTIVRYAVDALGRVTKRRATGETDLAYKYDTASYGYGQLGSESDNVVTRTYDFDSFGRPTTTTIAGSSKSYTISTLYDANFGRVKGLSYPNNLTVKYEYNTRGYLTHIKNAASGYVYQNITEMDKFGNIASSTLGNGLTESNLYYAASGQMANKTVNKTGQGQLLDINYSAYDGFGNLRELSVTTGPVGDQHTFSERFDYDYLHRLTSNQIAGITTTSYTYDNVGNITSKSDYATTYDYDTHLSGYSGGGENAVKKVRKTNGSWVGFSYDARGNMIKGDGLTEALYNAMDKPTSITKNGITNTFIYGPDHMRFKQTKSTGSTIYYADKLYEEEVKNGETTWRAYIGDVAVVSKSDNGFATIRYTHRDRLGSARLFTDRNGNVEAQRNFDPFGKPREASGGLKADNKLGDLNTAKTRRGFTDHEHLDEMELIHMNGRVYDYNLGRFMSVDPVIQSPGNSQSINPYSYIMNNPLAGTDPTGYSAECDDSGSCDIGNIAMDDVENIQVTKDGNMVVNTKDGSSYQVESINGADAKGAFKAAYNAGASPDLMSQGNIAKSSTETSSNMSGSGGGGCGGIFAAAAVACGAMPLPPIAGMADVSGQGKRNEEMASAVDGFFDKLAFEAEFKKALISFSVQAIRQGISNETVAEKAEQKASSKDRFIVIGETQKRVEITAKVMRDMGMYVETIAPVWPEGLKGEAAKSFNRRWINDKMDQGFMIWDIAEDPRRAYRSVFYKLEIKAIKDYPNYPRYQKIKYNPKWAE